MKKVLLGLLGVLIFANIANATPTSEMGDNRAAVVSVYGKDVSGNLVGMVLNSTGAITAEPAANISAEYTTQDLTAGALDYTTSFSAKTKMSFVLVKASEAITETITITLNSVNGASYDTVIASQALTADTSFYYSPEGGLLLFEGDEIDVNCTNNNTTGSVYVTVQGETLN